MFAQIIPIINQPKKKKRRIFLHDTGKLQENESFNQTFPQFSTWKFYRNRQPT